MFSFCSEGDVTSVDVDGLRVYSLYSCRVRTCFDSITSTWLTLSDVRTLEGIASPPLAFAVSAQVCCVEFVSPFSFIYFAFMSF